MAKNDFKAFATDRNANVMSQEEWEALPALISGFTAGKASSAQVNKVIRQASFIAAALAQFVSDKTQRDVLDNGDLPGFVELLGSGFAVEYLSRKNPFGDIKSDGTVKTALENLGLGDDARLSGNLTVKGGVWDTAPGNTPERVWSPNNKPSLTTLGVLDATTTQKGIVELATNAEMATGTSSSLVPSVAAVMSLFSKRSFAANDYVRIPDVPGGLIIQWVSGNASASGAFFAQMPIPFPNKLLFAGAVEAGANVWGTNSATTWGIDFANSSLSQVIAYARRIFPTTVTPESAAGLVIAIGN